MLHSDLMLTENLTMGLENLIVACHRTTAMLTGRFKLKRHTPCWSLFCWDSSWEQGLCTCWPCTMHQQHQNTKNACKADVATNIEGHICFRENKLFKDEFYLYACIAKIDIYAKLWIQTLPTLKVSKSWQKLLKKNSRHPSIN